MTYLVTTAPPRDLVAAIGFAVAVCVAVAVPQVMDEPGRIAAGLVYMLAGVLLLAAPRRPRTRPRRTHYRRGPLSGSLSRWEVR